MEESVMSRKYEYGTEENERFLAELREQEKLCWPKQLPERRMYHSFLCQGLILWRCLSVWVLPVSVICLKKLRRTHRVSFL